MNLITLLPKGLAEYLSPEELRIAADHLALISDAVKKGREKVHAICEYLNCKRSSVCTLEDATSCTYFLDEFANLIRQKESFEFSLDQVMCRVCQADLSKGGHGRASCREFRRKRAHP